MSDNAFFVKLASDDTICVVDVKGTVLCETDLRITQFMELKPDTRVEHKQNQYQVYKTKCGDIVISFPIQGEWVTAKATVQQLHTAMLVAGS